MTIPKYVTAMFFRQPTIVVVKGELYWVHKTVL